MRLIVDADACPVVDIAIAIAKEHGVHVLLVCDDSHLMQRSGVETAYVQRGADSADFYIVNRVAAGDIVLTQDYGLAAMCMGKGARAMHQSGLEYTNENIDALLASRHVSKKIRAAGGRTKGPAKRTKAQDQRFAAAFAAMLEEK